MEFIDVAQDKAALQEMMDLNFGQRHVPVILDDGRVEVGFGGR